MQRSGKEWFTLLAGAFAVLPLTASCSASVGQNELQVALPLGEPSLRQNWETTQLEPGLTYYVVNRGWHSSSKQQWRLRSPPLFTADEESAATGCFERAGIGAIETQRFRVPGTLSETYTVLSSSEFRSIDQARASLAAAADCGLELETTFENPEMANGPWHVAIIEIDPEEYRGQLRLALADGVIAERRTVPHIARENGAVAAVNANFFVMRTEEGIIGDVTGTAVLNGKLLSEATRGRTTVIIDNSPKVTLRFDRSPMAVQLAWSDGVTTEIDGVNRAIGLVRNCGNLGDLPTEHAAHDVTCTDSSELILLTPEAGFRPPEGSAVFEVRPDGRVTAVSGTSRSPDSSFHLVASGDRIVELLERLDAAESASVRTGFEWAGPDTDAFSGGPLLLMSGAEVFEEASEGWPITQSQSLARRDEMHRWINLRNPRTAIGRREDGTIIIVVVDGRRPDRSVGATIDELRAVMASLGAVDAINLDGGGSTTLAVRGELANAPSDATGVRPVGDALLLIPGEVKRVARESGERHSAETNTD